MANPRFASPAPHPTRAVPAAASGFTLLEMVVVILVVGILVTFAMLSIGNRPMEDKLENEARRMQAITQLAAEESEAKSVELGLRFSETGYRLLAVNDQTKLWEDYEKDGSLRRRVLAEPVHVSLRVDGRPIQLLPEQPPLTEEQEKKEKDSFSPTAAAKKKLEPQVLLLSSGEMSPFALDLMAPGVGFLYRLEGDTLGRLTLKRLAITR